MNAEALIGTVLGTSTLQQLIGQGGMGAVYLAQQSRPQRQVAVKVLMPATSLKPHQLSAFLERFRRETNAAASLEHPNIMPVYDYDERGGLAYLVMPYISGGTLRDVMEREGKMTFANAVNYVEQMAAALDFAHSRGVVHRDIKPANMLLTSDGRLLLTDFGLVKILSDQQSEQLRLTGAGAPVGTPDYMSPEQVIGADVDGRADQYSLAVVLFQMLTGTTPFQGETPMQIASQQLHMQPPAPRSLRPDLPEAAEQVLLRAMSKQSGQRFSSTQEFASAFRAALVSQPQQNAMSSAQNANGLLTSSGVRKSSLFDPKWQSTGQMPAFGTSQLNAAAPTASFNAQPEPERPAGTGLLSKTGLFPRMGANENTGALPTTGAVNQNASLFSTGQMPAATGPQPAPFGQAANQGFQADPSASNLHQAFFGQSNNAAQQAFPTGNLQQQFPTGNLQRPFPTGNLQQLSPSGQSTTSALSLLSTQQTAGGNTIKLTGPVKVVQVPVAPGQYVTGLLPVQKEVANPVSEPPVKRASKLQKIVLVAAMLVLLVGAIGGGITLMRSRGSSNPTAQGNTPTSNGPSASAQATATATANILFSDPLNQNIHQWPTGNSNGGLFVFKDGTYHITNQTNTGIEALVQQDFPQSQLNLQITMEQVGGDISDPTNTFGVILRNTVKQVNGKPVQTFYSFEILNNNSNSEYRFYKYDGNQKNPWSTLWHAKPGKEFHGGKGPNATNIVKVQMNGSSFTFFVNDQQVATVKDSSFASGEMGMVVNLKGAEIAFSNMLVTQN